MVCQREGMEIAELDDEGVKKNIKKERPEDEAKYGLEAEHA